MKKTIKGLVFEFIVNKALHTAEHTFVTSDQNAFNLLMGSLEDNENIKEIPNPTIIKLHPQQNKKRNPAKGSSKVLIANGLIPADIKEGIEQHPYALDSHEKSIMQYIAGLGFNKEHSYLETAKYFNTLDDHYTKHRIQQIFFNCLRKLLISRKPPLHGAALDKHNTAKQVQYS